MSGSQRIEEKESDDVAEKADSSSIPRPSQYSQQQFNLAHRMNVAKNAQGVVANYKGFSSAEGEEAQAPAFFIKGSESFGVNFKKVLSIETGRDQNERQAYAVKRSQMYKRLALKHWYKCILSEIDVDSDTAPSLDHVLVSELLARTAQVFSPIKKGSIFKADNADDYDALLAQLDQRLLDCLAELRSAEEGLATGSGKNNGACSSGAQAFINAVSYRYELVINLFKGLRKDYPGFGGVQETYLYLAWLALACTAGNVRALSDMASFLYAHCYVVSNPSLDLSGKGEFFEMAHKIKPADAINKSLLLKNALISNARDRSRYLFGVAAHSLYRESRDMQDGDENCYKFVIDLAYMLDSINVFDEIVLEVNADPKRYPDIDLPGAINGGVLIKGQLVQLLGASVRKLLADEATAALNRFMQNFSGTFVGLDFEGVVDAYYEHLTSKTSMLSSELLIQTAMLSVIAQKTIARRQEALRPGKSFQVAADDLVDEYAFNLGSLGGDCLKKLIYIYKVQKQDFASLNMKGNNEFTVEGAAASYQQCNFFVALSTVVMDHFIGAENSGLKDLIASFHAQVEMGNEVHESQLFQLVALCGHYREPMIKGDDRLANVMLGLTRQQLNSIATEYGVAPIASCSQLIALTVAAVKKHFVGDVLSEDVTKAAAELLNKYITNLQRQYNGINAMANVMGDLDIAVIVEVAERLPRGFPRIVGMDNSGDPKVLQEYALVWQEFSRALDQACVEAGAVAIRRDTTAPRAPEGQLSQARPVAGVNAHLPLQENASFNSGDAFDDLLSPVFGRHSDAAAMNELYADISEQFNGRISGQYSVPAAGYAEASYQRRWAPLFSDDRRRLSVEGGDEAATSSFLSRMWKAATDKKPAARADLVNRRDDSFTIG